MPKVSIVVPVYNVEEYVRKSVATLQNQTLKDIEIILVDDGSKDNSGKICDELAKEDKRIKVIHKKNEGVSVARNTGVDAASGDYIGYCDADDTCDEDMFEILYNNAIENNADISIVGNKTVYIDGKIGYVNGTEKKYLLNSEEAIKMLLGRKSIAIGVWCKIFKKDLCKSISFEAGRAIGEDKYYTFEAMRKAKVIFYHDVCKYNYILRLNSAMFSEFSAKKFDSIYFTEKIYHIVEKEYPNVINEAYVALCFSRMMILRNFGRSSKENLTKFKKERKEIEKEIKKIRNKDAKKMFAKSDYRNNFLFLKYFPSLYYVLKRKKTKSNIKSFQKKEQN